jgi:hypothetical protein
MIFLNRYAWRGDAHTTTLVIENHSIALSHTIAGAGADDKWEDGLTVRK